MFATEFSPSILHYYETASLLQVSPYRYKLWVLIAIIDIGRINAYAARGCLVFITKVSDSVPRQSMAHAA